MPFDGLPDGLLSDLAKLKVALDGVRGRWTFGELGAPGADHCAIGWLLEAVEWDESEATRLAIKYVWPALPDSAKRHAGKVESIWKYNDGGGRKRIERLFEGAVALAEKRSC